MEMRNRERKSLDGLWQCALDADGVGRDEGWWNGPLAGAREGPVPASYNDLFADAQVRNHVGDVWYQTLVRVPARWAGERIVLRFDAATHGAVVWVDGTRVVEHQGGYTPFEADLTDVGACPADRVAVVTEEPLDAPGHEHVVRGQGAAVPEGDRHGHAIVADVDRGPAAGGRRPAAASAIRPTNRVAAPKSSKWKVLLIPSPWGCQPGRVPRNSLSLHGGQLPPWLRVQLY
jgi:hypothetical protein